MLKCLASCLKFAFWWSKSTMTNDKPFFHPIALSDLWDVLGMVGGNSLSKKIARWPWKYQMAGWFSKGRPWWKHTPSPCQRRQGNKTALFDISEEQLTARDLLITFSQGRVCVTAAFYLSGNTFKKKTKPDVDYTEHPLPGLDCHSHGQRPKSFSLCPLKKKKRSREKSHLWHTLEHQKLSQLLQ